MNDTPKPADPRPDPRTERLKAALRDNLRRRKAQSRERSRIDAADAPPEAGTAPEPSTAADPDEPGRIGPRNPFSDKTPV